MNGRNDLDLTRTLSQSRLTEFSAPFFTVLQLLSLSFVLFN